MQSHPSSTIMLQSSSMPLPHLSIECGATSPAHVAGHRPPVSQVCIPGVQIPIPRVAAGPE